ncbi:hypothetical protein FACS189449_11160 [Alphaproteobacteria bacterium]|nr:hypothetical protein FACS189449_11160 [Alphaproteobacteria bacterium]
MSNLRLFESFSSIMVLSFLCFSCDALTSKQAEDALEFIEKDGS